MLLRLFVLFTLVPAVEIALLLRVGAIIGPLNTLLLIFLTGALGAYYARRQGLHILVRIQAAMNEGRMPGEELVDGAMLLVGGATLLTPGFLTDALGFALIFPPTRDAMKRVATRWIRRNLRRGDVIVVERSRRD